MKFISILVAAIAIYFAYKFSLWLGIAVTAAVIIYAIYAIMPALYEIQANKAYQAGDFNKSRDWYKKAVDTNRAKINTKTSYAYILMRTGDIDLAETVLNGIIRTKGVKPAEKNYAKQQRCMVYFKQGKLDEAIEEANEIFDDGNYKNTTLYGMLGYFKYLTEPVEDALKFCLEAYEYNSDDRDITDNLSLCYYKKGDYEKAKELSDKIISQNPQFVEAYYHGAQIAVKCGEYEKAKEYLEKIPDCRWSNMTTVTHEEVEKLIEEVNEKL